VIDKPTYRVPTMEEIGAVPWNGYTAISTFSGCGGSSLGYKMAGFRVLWASEFIPAAQDVYRLNHPDTILDTRDIRDVRPEEILEAIGLERGALDLLDGSPPCASFSTAGKREAGWGEVKPYSDTHQRVDDLFFEYARILEGLQPRVFVAENVSGLVKGKAKGYFKQILAALKACGYNVRAKLLDAQWLGVPQMRQRVIFMGVRNDLGLEPAYPTPLSYRYSVREALPWIISQGDNGGFGGGAMREAVQPSPTIGTGTQAGNVRYPPSLVDAEKPMPTIQAGAGASTSTSWGHGSCIVPRFYRDNRGAFGNGGDITDQPSPTVLSNTVGSHWVVEPESSMDGYAVGKEWDKLKPGGQSDKYFQLVRAPLDGPSQTVTQRGGDTTVGSVPHPTERRKFSIAELKRICAFPDDFQLTGTYSQQWERLGRAVPPVMMYHIAKAIREEILDKL